MSNSVCVLQGKLWASRLQQVWSGLGFSQQGWKLSAGRATGQPPPGGFCQQVCQAAAVSCSVPQPRLRSSCQRCTWCMEPFSHKHTRLYCMSGPTLFVGAPDSCWCVSICAAARCVHHANRFVRETSHLLLAGLCGALPEAQLLRLGPQLTSSLSDGMGDSWSQVCVWTGWGSGGRVWVLALLVWDGAGETSSGL